MLAGVVTAVELLAGVVMRPHDQGTSLYAFQGPFSMGLYRCPKCANQRLAAGDRIAEYVCILCQARFIIVEHNDNKLDYETVLCALLEALGPASAEETDYEEFFNDKEVSQ